MGINFNWGADMKFNPSEGNMLEGTVVYCNQRIATTTVFVF